MSARDLSAAQVAEALGVTIDQAANIVDKTVMEGWTWHPVQGREIVGIVLCRCGVVAEVIDPARLAPKCPNCGRPWKLETTVH